MPTRSGEPLGAAGDARLGDAAAGNQSTGEGRSAAQGSGLLWAVADRSGSGAAALCLEGFPVSRITTDFLAWGSGRLAEDGKRVWVLVWDNAAWHVSRAVRAWIGAHNRAVNRTGGVRILVCRLPVKSPWLNPIEPRWLHGKRAI